MNNNYNIVPPFRFINWIIEAFFLIIEKPVFWFSYALVNAFVFSLSSNILYLHFIGILSFIFTVNIIRKIYTGKKTIVDKTFFIKNIFFLFHLLFLSIVVRYIFWIFSASFTIFDDIKSWGLTDYLNPIKMILSNKVEHNIELFLFNVLVMPFHYIQMTFYTMFFCAAICFYPLFVWINNSAMFSYKLNLKVILNNMGNIAFVLLILVLLSLLVFLYSVSAFPYLYTLSSAIFYCMWADIFNEQKKQPIKATSFNIPHIINPNPQIIKNTKK